MVTMVQSKLYKCLSCSAVQKSLFQPERCNQCVCHYQGEAERSVETQTKLPNGRVRYGSMLISCPKRCKSKNIVLYTPGQLPKADKPIAITTRYSKEDSTPEMGTITWYEGIAYKVVPESDPENPEFIALKVRITQVGDRLRIKVKIDNVWVEKNPKSVGFNVERALKKIIDSGKFIKISGIRE